MKKIISIMVFSMMVTPLYSFAGGGINMRDYNYNTVTYGIHDATDSTKENGINMIKGTDQVSNGINMSPPAPPQPTVQYYYFDEQGKLLPVENQIEPVE